MTELEKLLIAKKELCIQRDQLADMYTEYIQKLLEFENDSEKYEEYVDKISDLEPATRDTKERMRELNRKIDLLSKISEK
jgi:hypothetical protein